jgi:hypothetical protein
LSYLNWHGINVGSNQSMREDLAPSRRSFKHK